MICERTPTARDCTGAMFLSAPLLNAGDSCIPAVTRGQMVMIIRSSKRANRKGFTLIELLVVVLILSILMAVALPLYLSAVADSQKKTCRANMQTIANTVQAARV